MSIDTKQWDRGLQQGAAQFQKFSGHIARLGDSIASGLRSLTTTFGGLTAGLAALSGVAVKVGSDFETTMSRVKAVTGATDKQFAALRAEAKRLGEETVFSANDAAEAMAFFGLAGYDADKIIAAMPATLRAAAAGQLSIAEAADLASKIMAGMQIPVTDLDHSMDVLVKAFTTANTDLRQLGEAMKYVGPVSAATGMQLEDIVAPIQALSNAGIQASMAGTTMRQILSELASPTKLSRQLFKELGIEFKNLDGTIKPLPDIIDQFNRKLKLGGGTVKIMGEQLDATGLAFKIFSDRGGTGFATLLTQGGDAIRKMRAQLQGAAGTAERIERTMLDNLRGSYVLLQSALEGTAINVAEVMTPALRKGLKATTDWLSANQKLIESLADKTWNGFLMMLKGAGESLGRALQYVRDLIGPTDALRESIGKLGTKIADLWAALPQPAKDAILGGTLVASLLAISTAMGGLIPIVGPLVAQVGMLVNPLAWLIGGAKLLGPLIGAIMSAISIGTGPLGITVALLSGLGFSMYKAVTTTEEGMAAWERLKTAFGGLIDTIQYLAGDALAFLGVESKNAGESLMGLGMSISTWLIDAVAWLLEQVPAAAVEMKHWAGMIADFFTPAWDAAWQTVKHFWDLIKDFVADAGEQLSGFWSESSDDILGLWDTLKQVVGWWMTIALPAIYQFMRDFGDQFFPMLKRVFGFLLDVVGVQISTWRAFFDALGGDFRRIEIIAEKFSLTVYKGLLKITEGMDFLLRKIGWLEEGEEDHATTVMRAMVEEGEARIANLQARLDAEDKARQDARDKEAADAASDRARRKQEWEERDQERKAEIQAEKDRAAQMDAIRRGEEAAKKAFEDAEKAVNDKQQANWDAFNAQAEAEGKRQAQVDAEIAAEEFAKKNRVTAEFDASKGSFAGGRAMLAEQNKLNAAALQEAVKAGATAGQRAELRGLGQGVTGAIQNVNQARMLADRARTPEEKMFAQEQLKARQTELEEAQKAFQLAMQFVREGGKGLFAAQLEAGKEIVDGAEQAADNRIDAEKKFTDKELKEREKNARKLDAAEQKKQENADKHRKRWEDTMIQNDAMTQQFNAALGGMINSINAASGAMAQGQITEQNVYASGDPEAIATMERNKKNALLQQAKVNRDRLLKSFGIGGNLTDQSKNLMALDKQIQDLTMQLQSGPRETMTVQQRVGGQAATPSAGTAIGSIDQSQKNITINANFNQRYTAADAKEIAKALDGHLKTAGVDPTGRSPLQSPRPKGRGMQVGGMSNRVK